MKVKWSQYYDDPIAREEKLKDRSIIEIGNCKEESKRDCMILYEEQETFKRLIIRQRPIKKSNIYSQLEKQQDLL